MFKTYYGPMLKAFAALEPQKQAVLHDDLVNLVARFNAAQDGTMVVPSVRATNAYKAWISAS